MSKIIWILSFGFYWKLEIGNLDFFVIDPICGMNLKNITDLDELSVKGKSFYFCGKECKKRFEKNPDKFSKEPLIIMDDVWKVFKIGKTKTEVLRGLSLRIWDGDFVALIGASGSGKSTTLNMLGLLDRPTSGKITLEGKDISEISDEKRAELRSEVFGFVFQQYNLIPWLTAYENTTLPLVFARKKIDREKITERFQRIDLKERMTHRPFELSGGEQQRTALLRALANDPKIIIGDEPTGNLDSATGEKILNMLIDLNKKQKKTLIIVTHDADIADKADQVITLKDGKMVRDHQMHRKIYTE